MRTDNLITGGLADENSELLIPFFRELHPASHGTRARRRARACAIATKQESKLIIATATGPEGSEMMLAFFDMTEHP